MAFRRMRIANPLAYGQTDRQFRIIDPPRAGADLLDKPTKARLERSSGVNRRLGHPRRQCLPSRCSTVPTTDHSRRLLLCLHRRGAVHGFR